MKLLLYFTALGIFLRAQTVYHPRTFFNLTIANDGRVEALIHANDAKWMTVYRNFLQINPDTRELMVVFNVAASRFPAIGALRSESHIMSSVIGSGDISWSLSENVTANQEGYIHSNMILWYDCMDKEMTMIYQSSSYWWWSQFDRDWVMNFDLDAKNQTLQLTRLTDEGWSESVEILWWLNNPHVHFQIIESLNLNDVGYPSEIILPVHHLSESVPADNWEMVIRTDRSMSPDNEWDITYMNATANGGKGYLQASIVRAPGENKLGSTLVAFLRDAYGQWVYRSTSEDDGFSWTDPIALPLPNPDQMSQAIYLHSGYVMLIYNPVQSMATSKNGDRYSNAHNLAVGLSSDLGLTWEYSRMLEYAYDGMFNYPVALQDPNCSRIYLTYSVETNELRGCWMLDECSDLSVNHKAYIKFTIITEKWVINEFDYRYEPTDQCVWELSSALERLGGFQYPMLDSQESKTVDWEVIILSFGLLGLILFNSGYYYFVFSKRKAFEYNDLQNKKEMTQYRTVNKIR
jgi:hypothetical protein